MEIGANIKAIHQARGLTLAHVSAVSGVDVCSLSLLENGKVDLRVGTLARIAAALGVQAADILASRNDDIMASRTDSPAETDTGLLTVEAVAVDLGTTPLAVARLIAKRQLKAVPLGSSGNRRILADEVKRYVGEGAVGFDMPPVNGQWFADIVDASALHSAIAKAAEDQLPESAPAFFVDTR